VVREVAGVPEAAIGPSGGRRVRKIRNWESTSVAIDVDPEPVGGLNRDIRQATK